MLTLDIKPRDEKTSLEQLRINGQVPAVFYGPKEKSGAVTIDARALSLIWKQAGETTLVALTGNGEVKNALIREMQYHPLTGAVIHVDFYVPEKGKKIEIQVPLAFVGVAPAEKAGLVVMKTMHEIEIAVAPENIPHTLEVDISALAKDGDRIVASDIKLPHGATLVTGDDEIIASVSEAKEEVVKAAPVAAEAAKPAEEKKAPEKK